MTANDQERLQFLDGLRGWGAVVVLAYHLFVQIYPTSKEAARALYHLAPFNGTLAVVVFFIVSGFSLSVSFLRTGHRSRLLRTAVGRYFRLAAPIVLATLIVHIAAVSGLVLNPARSIAASQLGPALKFSLYDVFFNNTSPLSTPIPQLWTMPLELAGSALVLAVLLLAGRTPLRFVLYLAASAFALWWSTLLIAFIAGVLIAELYLHGLSKRISRSATILLLPSLLLTAVLPHRGPITLILVATAITLCCTFSDAVRRFLSNRVSVFLGHISFPLYLLHGLVIYSYGTWIKSFITSPIELVIANISTVAVSILVAWLCRPIDVVGVLSGHYIGRFVDSFGTKRAPAV